MEKGYTHREQGAPRGGRSLQLEKREEADERPWEIKVFMRDEKA